jgi:hypothetical protein
MIKVKVTEKFDPNSINIKSIIKVSSTKWAEKTTNNIKISASGSRLKVRTGRLRNSIKNIIKQRKNKTTIKIGSWKVPYAKIHDDKKATTITTKTKRWLTVPVSENVKGRARQYSGTFVILTKRGTLIIAKRRGKKKINPLFTLKKFVIIRGTGFITDNVNLMKPFLITDIEMNVNNIKAGYTKNV